MKIFFSIFIGFALFTLANTILVAQDREVTIILLRHAEKDLSEKADKSDPELTAEGKQRAERLIKAIGKYRPGVFYSTNFKRTRDTLAPLAKKRGKEVQIYEAKQPQELINKMFGSGTKRFVVSGHSNTIPPLANLLIKKDLFKNLDESEYAVIWLVKMKNGKVTKFELLDY